ncbi:G2/mitotic-specific cyclin-2-like [Apium graveolens]|uniref:G2/mitotic-specific cyclin-2-like n=1 Tax=Apium graveolens TaxID=4045 RepID=UPI003D7914F9
MYFLLVTLYMPIFAFFSVYDFFPFLPELLSSTILQDKRQRLTKKPKVQIVDIDVADANNELAAVEYMEDMYKFYKLFENETKVFDYIQSHPEINKKMRAILVDWLIEIHKKLDLMPENIYLTINIIDRYLATEIVGRKELQLLGISSMLTTSKYEEIWAPEVNDFTKISHKGYTNQQVLVMEKKILGGLEWNLTVPTPYEYMYAN